MYHIVRNVYVLRYYYVLYTIANAPVYKNVFYRRSMRIKFRLFFQLKNSILVAYIFVPPTVDKSEERNFFFYRVIKIVLAAHPSPPALGVLRINTVVLHTGTQFENLFSSQIIFSHTRHPL